MFHASSSTLFWTITLIEFIVALGVSTLWATAQK